MAQFDPAQRRETLVFQNAGNRGRGNTPTFVRAGYLWVEYDDSPDRVLEPRSHIERFHDINVGSPVDPVADGTMVQSFEFVDSAFIRDKNGTEMHFFGG